MLHRLFLTIVALAIPLFGWLLWHSWEAAVAPESIAQFASWKAGAIMVENLASRPTLPLTEEKEDFVLVDTFSNGIDIQYPDQSTNQEATTVQGNGQENNFSLSFPKDYSQPMQVKLENQRVVTIQDLGGEGYTSHLLSKENQDKPPLWKKISANDKDSSFLAYTSQDGRKTVVYGYQQDQGASAKQLKSWTLYSTGSGLEKEAYKLENALVQIDAQGDAQVFFFGVDGLSDNQAQAAEPILLERAQRALSKELGNDLLKNTAPDFIIPKPYFIDNYGERTDVEWKWNEETRTLSLSFVLRQDQYPIALDPVLVFPAPGQSGVSDVITGGATSDNFGWALVAGDFNDDGAPDLAVGANGYSTNTGRVYIFYNDGAIPTSASSADVTITGETTNNYFGYSLAAGDFDADGSTDLVVGAYGYSTNTGRAYIFYNDGAYPSAAFSADVTITGETTNNYFGGLYSIVAGDFDADGDADLAVGAYGYSTNTGRAYIFYNDGAYPSAATSADVTITGQTTSNYFGVALTAGSLNSGNTVDLVVTAHYYNTQRGRAYIFYNDGSYPSAAASADVIIDGDPASTYLFGRFAITGDFDADGDTDLAVSAPAYSTNTGRAYIFYNDGSYPSAATSADVTITGQTTTNSFGITMATGDFDGDNRIDLAVTAYAYSTNTGRAYIFYNDGSYHSSASYADVIITGEATSNYFGSGFAAADFNADGRDDLVVGAYGYSSSTGRSYIFYSQNGVIYTNNTITGEAAGSKLAGVVTGDFNGDGKIDIVAGAGGYSTNTGRLYIFYGNGSGTYPSAASSADVIIGGETTNNYFGTSYIVGDFDDDGDADLAVGAYGYSTNTGRVYIFYNDGAWPSAASSADVIITGQATSNDFGLSFAVGDFDSDGDTDLVVGARQYSTYTGRAYIFYNDGTYPSAAASADVTITGEATNNWFGANITSGDLDSDGDTDLVIGAFGYTSGGSTSAGRVYIFYNDGAYPSAAASADVTITGQAASNYFGISANTGDLDSDGDIDLAVGAHGYGTNLGRAYIFYNDGTYPSAAASADVIIDGISGTSQFGIPVVIGDVNNDGRDDLVVSSYTYANSSNNGSVHVFYNDGAYPSNAVNSDLFIIGGAANEYFVWPSIHDIRGDGVADLIISATGYSAGGNTGRIWFFETYHAPRFLFRGASFSGNVSIQ